MFPLVNEVRNGAKFTDAIFDIGKGAKKASKALGAIDDAVDVGKTADDVKTVRRNELMSQATNAKLQNTIREMYRPNATIGDGGLGDAVRYELKTGKLVEGKSHIQKAKERLSNMKNILKRETLDTVDEKIIYDLIEDLENALEGK